MSTALTAIGQIAITVHDLPRAVAFYRDILGLKHLFDAGTLSFFDCGGVRLMLTKPEGTDAVANSILYYKTSDLQVTVSGMKAKGAHIESEPHLIAKMPDHDLWMAFLKDSEGNLVGLMSEVKN